MVFFRFLALLRWRLGPAVLTSLYKIIFFRHFTPLFILVFCIYDIIKVLSTNLHRYFFIYHYILEIYALYFHSIQFEFKHGGFCLQSGGITEITSSISATSFSQYYILFTKKAQRKKKKRQKRGIPQKVLSC